MESGLPEESKQDRAETARLRFRDESTIQHLAKGSDSAARIVVGTLITCDQFAMAIEKRCFQVVQAQMEGPVPRLKHGMVIRY